MMMIDPVAFLVFGWPVRWYGLCYLLSFLMIYLLGKKRVSMAFPNQPAVFFEDCLFYGALGAIVGGRVGYMLFYDLAHWWDSPLQVFRTWEGGMSFHGGMLGVGLAFFLLSKRKKVSFLALTDFMAPLVPIGLGLGRLGNWVNGELWGRVTDVPWAVIFPMAGPEWRHPSPLYEALLEGVLLWFCLWCYTKKPRGLGRATGVFLMLYAVFRMMAECFREPDVQWGLVFLDKFTMGQLLSLPMLLLGVYFWCRGRR